MKTKITAVIFSLVIFSGLLFAQEPSWQYVGEVKFPVADTGHVSPYLISVDEGGNVWVVSSKVLSVSGRNAVFYADSNATELTKFIDYDENGDSDSLLGFVGAIRGIATIGNSVFVVNSIPYPHFPPNTVASVYRYTNKDTNLVEKFGFNIFGSGYGTYIMGGGMTRDTFLIVGMPFGGTSVRMYSYNRTVTTPSYGSYVPPAQYGGEPGGPNTGGFDVIRDVAALPDGDYNSPETPFFTSRNSYSSTQQTGGIASWTGGTQSSPGTYTGTRVIDQNSYLAFDRFIPYGITVDKDNRLWVAGSDSTRKWVKAFEVTINFADFKDELPSATDPNNPDPAGAPFGMPSDVALTKDGLTAYVSDYGMRTVYKFKYTVPSDVNEGVAKVTDFQLNQNYPNPFNPMTQISYSIPSGTNVKLIVTNSLGQVVSTLVDTYMSAGNYSKVFDASDLSSGVYYYSLITNSGTISKKMMLMK